MRWALLLCVFASTVFVGAEILNVHIIPHTHDDVGWLKTIDQYYYGLNNSIQYAGVQYIIDNVVMALEQNPDRTFIYVESAFFARWWSEQTSSTQELVRELVRTGRLEFISGGWCMNDEATAHYVGILDQMVLGHRFLLETFGVTPRIAWQIDPFGHSVNMAGLFALMGFDALFFARLDYQDYAKRHDNKDLEFIWRGTNSYDAPTTDLFTSIFHSGYGAPSGMWYESGDDPVADDPKMLGYNVNILADKFYNEMMSWASSYKTNNILVPFGSDFLFQNADMEYKNMEKLMKYIKNNPSLYPNINIFYSTPSRYIKAVNDYQNANGITWSVKVDDFFPYADNAHAFWTGYFTSRPTQKGFTQSRQSLLHAGQNLYTLAPWAAAKVPSALENIKKLEMALGVGLHHDSVTGTEKQHVCDDYILRLHMGTVAASSAITGIAGVIAGNASTTAKFQMCPLLNVSVCPSMATIPAAGNSIPVVMYNTLSWPRSEYVRLPVPTSNVQVLDSSLKVVTSQVLDTEPADILADGSNRYTVVFRATVPALGLATYFVSMTAKAQLTRSHVYSLRADTVFSNEYVELTFDGASGLLRQVKDLETQKITQVSQNFMFYKGSMGNLQSTQASGAYIFRPADTDPITISPTAQVTVISGPLVTEIRQVFNNYVNQTIRLYAGQSHIEVIPTIGPIDITDLEGKEVITRYNTDLSTQKTFYTDSNGLEMQKRILNYRPTWDVTLKEPIAGNYYPIVAATAIKDTTKDTQLTVIVDRAEGTASLAEGQLEIMLHRRLLRDDSRGVGEPLNEKTVARITHFLIVNTTSGSPKMLRRLQHVINNPFILMFGEASPASQWVSKYATTFSPLRATLPDNVLIEGLLPLDSGELILRLQHTFAKGEDNLFSQPVTVNLDTLFNDLSFMSLTETQITGNQALNLVSRLSWAAQQQTTTVATKQAQLKQKNVSDRMVTLKPLQFRTYRARLA